MDLSRDQRTTLARPPVAALLAEAVALFLALRIGLSLLGALVATTGVWGPCHFEEALVGWRTMPELLRDGPAFPLAGIWERWDACWYMKIATYGYEPGERSVAFFPLYPALVRSAGTLTTLPYPVAGLIVSAAGYVAAMTGLLRLVSETHGVRAARWTVRFLSVFPAAFFLLAPFSEAVFLATAVWCLVFARERRWSLALLFGALAGLARAQGLLLALPLAWEAFLALREARAAGRIQTPAELGRVMLTAAAALAPVAAFLAFGLAARALTGETPIDAQSLWGGTEFHPPWVAAAAAASWAIDRGDGIEAINLAALLGSAALLVAGARRMPLTYSLYAWPPLLLIATRVQPTPLTSTTRYVLVLFPIFVVAALLTERRPRLRWGWLIVSSILLVALATIFLQGDFVA
ncbi:MAG TPA: hypothetical protein VEW95_06285 [Candidatus Limnocylindrales bacterium]|nr:hypothetical protein [Candidatus Limnocylindrales bacterium]